MISSVAMSSSTSRRENWSMYGQWIPTQELTLTSSMVLASSLTMTRTTLLGNPYTACSYQNTHQICDLYMVSKKMETLCKCRYFAFKTIDTSLTECSYSDMVTCGNKIVQSYIFNKSGKHHKQESCSPSCLSYGFQLNEITVS